MSRTWLRHAVRGPRRGEEQDRVANRGHANRDGNHAADGLPMYLSQALEVPDSQDGASCWKEEGDETDPDWRPGCPNVTSRADDRLLRHHCLSGGEKTRDGHFRCTGET